MTNRTRYLVAYDIRDDRRLRLTREAVKTYGYSLQYSVFVCDLTKSEKIRMKQDIADVINAAVDSVVWVDLGPAGVRGAECFEFMGARDALPTDGTPTIL
jgi:CRISPR-associated protein Cas2